MLPDCKKVITIPMKKKMVSWHSLECHLKTADSMGWRDTCRKLSIRRIIWFTIPEYDYLFIGHLHNIKKDL